VIPHAAVFGCAIEIADPRADSFDEGIDLDTLLVGLQLALLVFALARVRRQGPISNSRRTSFSDMRSWDSSRQPTISGVGRP
jgi:hypothetical protein